MKLQQVNQEIITSAVSSLIITGIKVGVDLAVIAGYIKLGWIFAPWIVLASFLIWFLSSENVPSEFVYFTPHITTLIVLSSASQKLRMPQKIGQPYRKGELN